jgi:hypothetical protein
MEGGSQGDLVGQGKVGKDGKREHEKSLTDLNHLADF